MGVGGQSAPSNRRWRRKKTARGRAKPGGGTRHEAAWSVGARPAAAGRLKYPETDRLRLGRRSTASLSRSAGAVATSAAMATPHPALHRGDTMHRPDLGWPDLQAAQARQPPSTVARWPASNCRHWRDERGPCRSTRRASQLRLSTAILRSAFFDDVNHALRSTGLTTGWRDETDPVLGLAECATGTGVDSAAHPAPPPASTPSQPRPLLARFERAASRFWSTVTFGAHCNRFCADAQRAGPATVGSPAVRWTKRWTPVCSTT